MKTKALLLAALVGVAALSSASAGVRFGISVGWPLPVVVATPVAVAAPVVMVPPVVVAAPGPGYYPSADYVWTAGCWSYRAGVRVWAPGYWAHRPAPVFARGYDYGRGHRW